MEGRDMKMNSGHSKRYILQKKALNCPRSLKPAALFISSSLSKPKFLHERRNDLAKLRRIRDFISLFLSYPMRTVHDSELKAWTHQLSNAINPLRYLEGLIPKEIIMNIESGSSSMFTDVYGIPDAILNLAVDLAVHQLMHTLLSGDDHVRNIHRIMLSTRSDVEKKAVMKKIEAALKDKDNVPRVKETFSHVFVIDASMYHTQVEVHVRRQMIQQLLISMTKEDHLQGNDSLLIMTTRHELLRKKYLVLVIDGDAEETLDLKKVGFPEDKPEEVVVLITTKSAKEENYKSTLSMDMKIGTRDHLLPWEVFCHTTGNELVCSSNAIQTFAYRIVEVCGGHLLAILLVAKSLKDVGDVKHWELAYENLRCPHPCYDIDLFHGHTTVMINAFMSIWDGMNKTQKHCLMCCLFIPQIKFGELDTVVINHWISSLSMDVGEAEHSLRVLLDRFVLLQFKDVKCSYIQMPEETYAILQLLNAQNPLFMKKVGVELTEPPNRVLWHNVVHIELANSRLSELPMSPNCLELKVLKLQNNADLTKMPPDFFFKMPQICIMDLSYTSIRELPNSFFELEQLRELYMKGCECFMKLPPEVGKLKKLEKLDLDGTEIIHLPEEIQELTNLQSLTLCFYEYRSKKNKQYTCSTIIPFGVISKFKELKHLSIDVNRDDERWYENIEVVLPEIFILGCLQTISLYIPQPELLKLIPNHIFELDFRFVIGQHMSRIISGAPPIAEEKFQQSDCSLKLVKAMDVSNEIKKVVQHSKALFLDRHMTTKSLSDFEMMNLEQLRVCILAECKEMQTIVDGKHSYCNKDMMPHLLCLSVSYMKNLRSIWEGSVLSRSRNSFGMLKSLALHNCPNLTTVFTLDFLGDLSLLKEVIVRDCPKVTTLISHASTEAKTEVFLPKLRKVLLLHLPKLYSISNGLPIGPRLEIIGIYDCPKLQSLSYKELSSLDLMVIKGETKWWNALKWSDVEGGKACLPSRFDQIFSSISSESDVMIQLGIYNDEDIDDGPGASVVEPSLLERMQSKSMRPRVLWTRPTELKADGQPQEPKKEIVHGDETSWGTCGQKEVSITECI